MQDVNLKPLEPYDFAGLILPKTPDKVAMEWLPIAKLVVDEAYQRPISRSGLKNIEKIALGFRWSRFSPVIVTKILGQDLWAIIDGQHRTHAALALGYQQVPCYIVLAAGADAAQIFAAVNGNITPISLPALYKAALAAEEPWALGIKTACAAAGIKVLMSNASVSRRQPYDTLAVGTLRRAYLDCGKRFWQRL